MYISAPLTLPSGVVRDDTRYGVNGRYYDTNMVRFFKGRPERWGGWSRLSPQSLGEPARGGITWRANDGTRYAAFGTANKLWLLFDGALYDITPSGLPAGDVDSLGDTGIGELGVGSGPWGGDIDETIGVQAHASVWSLDKWGEDLVAVRRGSTLYHWVKANGPSVRAQPVAGAPSECYGVFVTEDRHAVVFGAHDGTSSDPIRVQWPNQETLTNWTPSAITTAGDLRLEDGNEIVGGIKVTDGHILLTDISAYSWKHIGGDFVFSKRRLAGNQGIIGPNAGIEFNGDAFWMAQDGFSSYNGRVMQVPCDVHKFVFDNINRAQRYKVFCGTNREFGEIIWFYPDSTSVECNRYVTFQPADNVWTIGALDRTTWIDDGVLSTKPIAISPQGFIFSHEVGHLGDGQPIPYRLETGDIDIKPQGTISATGNHMMLRKVVPDYMKLEPGTHTLTVLHRDFPQAPQKAKGPYSFSRETQHFEPRARGMTMSFRYEGDAAFRMGDITGYISQSGGR